MRQQEQSPQVKQEITYISKAKFMTDSLTGKYNIGDIVHLDNYELYSEDYQNYEDGVFIFNDYTKMKGYTLCNVQLVLTCNHDNCIKDEMKQFKDKYGTLQYKNIEHLNFKITDIEVKELPNIDKDVIIYGEI